MKYQPSLPSHNDNVAQEHPLKDFLKILTGLAALALLVEALRVPTLLVCTWNRRW